MINIQFKQCHSTNYSVGRAGHKVEYLTIHYTANNGDTAQNNATYFANNSNLKASANFFVDENPIVWQSVKESDTAYHCGTTGTYKHAKCRNYNSIGIELCSRKDSNGKYYFKDETVKNAATLVKELMKKYNIPIENVIRHYDVTGKNCPAPFVEDVVQWTNFINMLKEDTAVAETTKLDNTPEEYAKSAVNKAITKGILKGNEKGDYMLHSNITRQDVLVFLERAGVL